MDLFTLLRSEHRKVKELVAQMSKDKNGRTRQKQIDQLKEDLLPHMHAEENSFYAHLLSHSKKKDDIYEAFEEHFAARAVLSDIETTPVDDPSWTGKILVLQELLKHHIEEEESTVFTELKKELSKEQAIEMIQQFMDAKQGEFQTT